MNATVTLIILALASTAFGLFLGQAWIKRTAIAALAAIAVFTVVFSMNDMRAHGSEAKRAGHSSDYIAGMVERDQRTIPRRAVIFFSVSGLALLAFFGTRRKP